MSPTLDAQRWRQIRAAFDQLVELDPVARNEQLARIGAIDADLQRQVETLLASDADAGFRLARIDVALAAPISPADARARDADPLRLVGRTVSHFRIIEPIAAGGMGVVYRAEDTSLRRTIALKFPLPAQHLERGAKERFLHEARSAGALDHPNICGIHETGETDDGQLFLAMPLYAGETLAARVERDGPLAIADALSICAQIAAGLSAAHRAGIVHRDVKPANLMLLRDGTVKILDFGLAKVHDLALTAPHARIGTVSYMAPEQIQGRAIDGRADLWALGVILYELLTGRRPFAGDYDVAIAHAIVHVEPQRASVLRPEIGAELDDVVWKLMRKDPAARYQAADPVAVELAAHHRNASGHRRSRNVGGRKRRTSARAAAVALTALVLLLSLSAWLLSRRDPGVTATPRRVAVLPFSEPPDANQNHFLGLGLSDAIGTELARFRALIVPSYGSTASYRGTTRPLPQIARELSAAAIVAGSVQRDGDRTFVDLQLFDAKAGRQVWAHRYEHPATEALEIQRSATKAIVAALRIDLTQAEHALLARPPTTSARAYDLYLRGKELELRPSRGGAMTDEDIREAQSLFSRARDLDPNFARARARLAVMHVYSVMRYDPTVARREQARLEAESALRIQPGLAEAHEALGAYWDVAVKDYAKSIEQHKLALHGWPNSADLHQALAVIYRKQGRWEESIAELDVAQQLEPHSPGPAHQATFAYTRLRRYAESIKAWDRVIRHQPNNPMHQLTRAYVFMHWQGAPDTLEAVLRRLPPAWDPDGARTLARYTVARVGRRHSDALAVLKESSQEVVRDLYGYRPLTLLRAETYRALGMHADARSNYEAARAALVDSIASHPEIDLDYSTATPVARMRIALGLVYAGLGRNQEAAREARRAMELVPLSTNIPAATAVMAGAAEVFAQASDPAFAIELLELLLSMPAGREISVPLLRVDPAYDALRGDVRFEQLLARFSN